MTDTPCVFCDIAAGKAPAHVVYENELFLVPTYGGDVLDRFFNALENFQESSERLFRLKSPESLREAAELLKGD